MISERGVDALTFRAVAEAARVPLSSTTYYFRDKDDLLIQTIRSFRQHSSEDFQATLARDLETLTLPAALAAMIEEFTVRQHARLLAEYGLYLCTLHRATLRAEVMGWRMEELVSPHTDPATARALGYLAEGILLQSAMEDVMFFAPEVQSLFERVMP